MQKNRSSCGNWSVTVFGTVSNNKRLSKSKNELPVKKCRQRRSQDPREARNPRLSANQSCQLLKSLSQHPSQPSSRSNCLHKQWSHKCCPQSSRAALDPTEQRLNSHLLVVRVRRVQTRYSSVRSTISTQSPTLSVSLTHLLPVMWWRGWRGDAIAE